MAWRIEISKAAEKRLQKMDRELARRIATFLRRLKTLDDPRATGAALNGSELGEFWKYRVGDWRLICEIHDKCITIEVLRLGNRRDVSTLSLPAIVKRMGPGRWFKTTLPRIIRAS